MFDQDKVMESGFREEIWMRGTNTKSSYSWKLETLASFDTRLRVCLKPKKYLSQ